MNSSYQGFGQTQSVIEIEIEIDVCWQVRDEEMEELDQLLCNYCELPAAGGVENSYGKVNVLLQTYICRGEVDSFSLMSDLSYVAQVRKKEQNGTR